MRLEVRIDDYTYRCDSANPRLIAAWLYEVMALPHWNPATYCTVQAYPSALGETIENGQVLSSDWIMDSRYWQQNPCRTPQEAVKALAQAVKEFESFGR